MLRQATGCALQRQVIGELHQVLQVLARGADQFQADGGMRPGDLPHEIEIQQQQVSRGRGSARHDVRSGAEGGGEAERISHALEHPEDLFAAIDADAGEPHPACGKDVQVAAGVALREHSDPWGIGLGSHARSHLRQHTRVQVGEARHRLQQPGAIERPHHSH